MKQAFKELHPVMGDKDDKKQRLARIIINYERDIKEYVNNWSQQNQKAKLEHIDSNEQTIITEEKATLQIENRKN